MILVSSTASQAGLPSGGSSRSLLTPVVTLEPPFGARDLRCNRLRFLLGRSFRLSFGFWLRDLCVWLSCWLRLHRLCRWLRLRWLCSCLHGFWLCWLWRRRLGRHRLLLRRLWFNWLRLRWLRWLPLAQDGLAALGFVAVVPTAACLRSCPPVGSGQGSHHWPEASPISALLVLAGLPGGPSRSSFTPGFPPHTVGVSEVTSCPLVGLPWPALVRPVPVGPSDGRTNESSSPVSNPGFPGIYSMWIPSCG